VTVPLKSPEWLAWDAAAERLGARFDSLYRHGRFDYRQPLRLQQGAPQRLRKPYTVPVAYTDWGPADAPLLLACGGVANTAMRFAFLAADLQREGFRVVCMDWLGRGRSGWLADDHEYVFETYLEQLRQMIHHLGAPPVALLGSSMGGSLAIELAARHPALVSRLILNDVGPHIPRTRRQRRSHTLARWYVFRTPADIERKVGAAQKNDGPVGDDIRRFIAWHQTRWSAEEGGRVYRHDPRALLAYRDDARHGVNQWAAWEQVSCPVLLLHGLQSDALLPATVARMQQRPITLAQIPDTGHTPVLSDRHQTLVIRDWLRGGLAGPLALSIPHARARLPAGFQSSITADTV
jgi:pimeloyl-ACP methyl ester carboxylesterase